MGCGIGTIKYLLFIFNFIFAVCGLAILAFGVLVHLQVADVNHHVDVHLDFPSITLIVIGTIIFVISFCGCCGAIRESHCMTITFASFLLFILVLQIAVAVYAFVIVKSGDEHVTIVTEYRKIFSTYDHDNNSKEFVDMIQSKLQCCGLKSYADFVNRAIPGSCCGDAKMNTCTANNAYKEGCEAQIEVTLTALGIAFGSIAIVVASVELIGIIFALCLANSIKNAERRGYRV